MSPSRLLLALVSLLPALQLVGCGKSEADAVAKTRARLESADVRVARIELKNLVQAHPKSGEARLLAGLRMLSDGEAAAAAAELQRALTFGVAESRATPPLAEALVQSGQAARVVQTYADTQLPDAEAQAWLQAVVASANMALGNQAAARVAVDRALKASSASAKSQLAKARLMAFDNNAAGAMALADAVLAGHANQPEAWMLKGDLHLRMPDGRQLAQQAYEKAVAAGPDMVGPRMAVMALQVAQGDLQGARQHLAELQKRAPTNINTAMAEGQLAFVSGEHARAREVFQGLLGVMPENIGLLLVTGENEMQMGSAQQAEAHFAKASALAPRNQTARRLLAKAQLRMGQIPKALATLEPLVDMPDATAEVLAMAAEARSLNGETRVAQSLYDRLAKLKPTDPRLRTLVATASFGRADDNLVFSELRSIASQDQGSSADLALVNAHLSRGQTDAALKALLALERKQPKDPVPPHLRGQVLAKLGKVADARQSFEAALALRPAYFPSLAALAALDMREGKPAQARERFAAVVKAQPKNATAMLALAEVLVGQGAPAKDVRAQINAAIKAAPGDVAARVALVNHHFGASDFESALNAALAASAAMPDNLDLLALLARCQIRQGQTSQALATYGKITTLQPKSPQGHLGMAEVYLAGDQLDLAQRSVSKALELAPGLTEARAQAIMVALRQKQPDKALEIARQVQADRPAEAVGFILEGEVLMRQRQWAPAATVLRKALDKAAPGTAPVKLYQALARSDKPAEAELFSTQWLKTHPGDTALLFTMGDTAQSKGDLLSAQKHYERVLALQANHPLALNNLAMLMIQQNKPGALPLAQRAAAAKPNEPAVLDTLALAQAAEGQADEAVKTQRQALALAPESPDLRLALARLLIQAGERAQAKTELDKLARLESRFAHQDEVARLQKTLVAVLPGR